MAYDVAAIRNKLKKQMSGKMTDPDEFRPPKAESQTEPMKFRFFILPPIAKGDKLKSGVVSESMEHFFIAHGNHWINDKPHACPRVWDGTECDICQTGFDLLKDEKEEKARASIIKTWMPSTYYMVNIYFTGHKCNPEELRGKVKFFNAPKTCFDIWTSTLLKDDAGDPEDPSAFGVFFDENSAFQFQLEVIKQGKNNSYKTSKFIHNNGKGLPMLDDPTKLHKLLEMRHNLFDKIEKPDSEKIAKLAKTLLDGDDDEDSGFDEDEVATKKESKATESKKETKAQSTTKKETKKPEPEPEDDEDDDEDDVSSLLDDDDDSAALADESPLEDDEDEKPAKPAKSETKKSDTKKPEAKKPQPEPEIDDTDDEDEEIDALLNQLEDDD